MTWIRQAFPLVLVALVVFQSLRTCWLERYVVSSESMEPTFHGDPVTGDRVLVDKSAAWWWDPQRGDLVVVRNPDDPASHFVKRVVGLGGDRVRLLQGDVFLWESELGDWSRWEKDPFEFRDMRMAYFEYPGGGEEPAEGFVYGVDLLGPAGAVLQLSPAGEDLESLRLLLSREARTGALHEDRLPGHLGTTHAVDTRFLDSRGEMRGLALPCQDVGMEIEVTPAGDLAGLQLVFEHRGRSYSWSYGADGQVQFYGAGEALGEPVAADPLVADRVARIEFGYLDGHFFLIAGNRLAGSWNVELPLFGEASDLPGPLSAPHNLLHVGVAGGTGGSITVTRLSVFHDVYYQALRRPFREPADIPVGELWLLGDNTFDSNDSRSKGSFPRSDLVGRPVMILGPVGRLAVLPR